MNINTSMMSSSMSKTTGCGGGFLGKTGDEWADIGLTVGGAALATAGVIGIGSLIFDNFGGGGGSSSSSEKKEDKILVVTQDGRVITAQPQEAAPQLPAKSSQDELNNTLTMLLKKIAEMADQERTTTQLPAPQPQVQPQPKYPAKETLEEMLKKMAETKDIPMSQPQPQPKYLTEDALDEKLKQLMDSFKETNELLIKLATPTPVPEAQSAPAATKKAK